MKEDRLGRLALRIYILKDDDWIQPSHCRDGSLVFEEDRVHFCLETSIYQSLLAEMLYVIIMLHTS